MSLPVKQFKHCQERSFPVFQHHILRNGEKGLPKAEVPFAPIDYALYIGIVFAWSTSWIALALQLGVVSPIVSLFWRFLLAAALMGIWVLLTKRSLYFPWRHHIRFMAMGCFIFSFNFLCFYNAGLYIPSGLLSVAFSFAAVVNVILARIFFGQTISAGFAIAIVMGIAGIIAMFWPEIAGTELNGNALFGLGLSLIGTVFFCLGNMVSLTNQAQGNSLVSSNFYGMVYGTIILGSIALITGKPFIIEPTWRYIGALSYSSLISTIVAFATYLTLLSRIGAARAGYATVLFPVFALLISTFFENYKWTPMSLMGITLVLIGNLIILTRRKAS